MVSGPVQLASPYCSARNGIVRRLLERSDPMNNAIDITKTTIVYALGFAMIVVVAFGGAL